METLTIQTKQKKEVVDITEELEKILAEYNADEGICHLFVAHATCALTTVYIDPENELDLIGMLDTSVAIPHHEPKKAGMPEHHEHMHFPSHLPNHITASLIGASLAIPVKDGQLILGDFQHIALVELNGPAMRKIIVDTPK